MQQWVCIVSCDRVHLAIIDTEPCWPILLSHKHNWQGPRVVGWLSNFSLQHLLQQLLSLLSLGWWYLLHLLLYWGHLKQKKIAQIVRLCKAQKWSIAYMHACQTLSPPWCGFHQGWVLHTSPLLAHTTVGSLQELLITSCRKPVMGDT